MPDTLSTLPATPPYDGEKNEALRHPCLYPGCLHTFARPYDLDHHLEIHFPQTVPRLDCPYAWDGFCGREGERGFIREDHRKEHIRNVHPPRRGTSEESMEDVSTLSTPVPPGPRKRLEESTRTRPMAIPGDRPKRFGIDEFALPVRPPTVLYPVRRQHVWDHKILVEEQERPISEERGHSISNEKEQSTVENEKRLTAKEGEHLTTNEEEHLTAKEEEHSVAKEGEHPSANNEERSNAKSEEHLIFENTVVQEEHSKAEEEEHSVIVEAEHSIASRVFSSQA